jgi:thiol:disulfide interchange protein DsbD
VIDIDMVVGVPMAAALGLTYGMGPCLISCLPFLGPVFLFNEGGIKRSWRIILPLSLGRLTVYTGLAATVGWGGHYAKGAVANTGLSLVIGSAALMMGLALLFGKRAGKCAQAPGKASPLMRMQKMGAPKALMPGGLFLMGVGMAMSPCAPLGLVLFSASASGSAAEGGMLGLSFGLGAVLVPALAYGIGMAYFGERLREQLAGWRHRLEQLSALLLVSVGVANLARW